MKFFSNEAKDTDRAGSDEDRDRAETDTVTVPQQRAGSPWSDAPGGTEDEIAAREGRPGTEELPEQARPGDAGQPWTRPAAERDQPEPGAGGTTYGPDGAVVGEPAGDRAEPDAIKDEGTFDSPTAVEPRTGEPLDEDAPAKTADEAPSDEAKAPSDEAEAEAGDRDKTDAADTRVSAAAAVPVAAAAVPVGAAAVPVGTTAVPVDAGPEGDRQADADTVPVAAAAAPPADRFFPDGDAYADRFRDIQLRFVDSPKDATAEAAALLGEALDKLAEALKSQKGALASGSEDTEKLRLELRGYRDLLNRVVTL